MTIHILIVDDNPDNLRLLADILREKGYQTRKAISGSLALKSLEAATFDLILMDINLPRMNGYEVCQKIKQNPKTKNIPVIFISAYNEPLDKVKAFEVGGSDYLTKPLNSQEVFARIENQVKIISLQKEISRQNIKLRQQYIERSKQLQKTEQSLKKSQEKLLDQSLRDHVTGLDNRVVFMGKLRGACRKLQQEENYNFAVLVIQCIYLDIYNHIFSFELKDQILSAIAQILSSTLPSNSSLARIDNNNFVILLSNIDNISNAIDLVKNLYYKYKKPLIFDGKKIIIDFYCGIVLGRNSTEDNQAKIDVKQAEYLLQNAKIALFEAQKKSDNQYHYSIFTDQLRKDFKAKLQLTLNLLDFLEHKKIKINYYPVINLENNQIKSLYTQTNWDIFEKIPQEEIISLLNNNNYLEKFNKLLMEKGCEQIRRCQEQILWDESFDSIWEQHFSIIIPLSSEQFFQPSLCEQIKNISHDFNIDRENIALAIPDVAILTQPRASKQILEQLKQLNIQLSINNFSTNYFELNQEYQFPFDNLIINSYFLQDNNELLPKIITQVHKNNMTITVSGITEEPQITYLQEIGCDFGQGDWITQQINLQLIL